MEAILLYYFWIFTEKNEPDVDLKDWVRETKYGGVRYIYVPQKYSEYFPAPSNVEDIGNEPSENVSVRVYQRIVLLYWNKKSVIKNSCG